MIRYIHIGDQITDEADQFAFFDTVADTFVSLSGEQVFDDEADLRAAWGYEGGVKHELGRLLRLIPEKS